MYADGSPYGLVEYAAIDDGFENYSASKVGDIFRDPEAVRVLLLEARVFNPGTGDQSESPKPLFGGPSGLFGGMHMFGGTRADSKTVKVRLADAEFHTGPDASIPNRTFEPRLISPYNFRVNLFRNGEVLGGSTPSLGAIRIANADAEKDALTTYHWDGRRLEMWLGIEGLVFDEFEKVFEGTAEGITWDEETITIQLRDPRAKLESDIQENLYEGTGDIEGEERNEGRPKPLVYGEADEVRAVLIDSADLIYQVHDGPVREIQSVYDAGVSLTDGGDVSDIFASSVSVSNGSFKTEEARGLLKLGAAPEGTVTADVRGSDLNGTFVETAADIFERIVKAQGGLKDSEVAGAFFNTLNNDNSATQAMVIPDEPRRIIDVLSELMTSVGGWWTFSRLGQVQVGQLKAPASAPDRTLKDPEIFAQLQRRVARRPVWRVRLGYDRTWEVQGGGALAASVSATGRAQRTTEFRYVESKDGLVKRDHGLADSIDRNTLMISSSDAQSEADRVLDLMKVRRDLYTVNAGWQMFRFDLNDTVELDVPRFDLDGGKSFRVIGIEEDVSRRETILTLWG